MHCNHALDDDYVMDMSSYKVVSRPMAFRGGMNFQKAGGGAYTMGGTNKGSPRASRPSPAAPPLPQRRQEDVEKDYFAKARKRNANLKVIRTHSKAWGNRA